MTQALAKRADGSGRTVICEVMFATAAIRNLIREGKNHQIPSFMQSSGGDGMLTFDQHLAQRVQQQDDHLRAGASTCATRPKSSSASPDGCELTMTATIAKTFDYEALDSKGKRTKGKVEASSEIRRRQTPCASRASCRFDHRSRRRDCSARLKLPGLGNRVGLKDLAIFARQFATMTSSGLSLLRARCRSSRSRRPNPP